VERVLSIVAADWLARTLGTSLAEMFAEVERGTNFYRFLRNPRLDSSPIHRRLRSSHRGPGWSEGEERHTSDNTIRAAILALSAVGGLAVVCVGILIAVLRTPDVAALAVLASIASAAVDGVAGTINSSRTQQPQDQGRVDGRGRQGLYAPKLMKQALSTLLTSVQVLRYNMHCSECS
jgi:hypothetical protein